MQRYLGTALLAAALVLGGSPSIAAPHLLHYLTVDELRPALVLPAPPAPGSLEERGELAEIHALIAAAPPARLDQARWDDAHETLSLIHI